MLRRAMTDHWRVAWTIELPIVVVIALSVMVSAMANPMSNSAALKKSSMDADVGASIHSVAPNPVTDNNSCSRPWCLARHSNANVFVPLVFYVLARVAVCVQDMWV